MSITVKGGLVIYRPAPGNRPQIVWADCERCGTQAPMVQSDGYHSWVVSVPSLLRAFGLCSLCEGEAGLRYVTWKESKRKHVKCDKRCLEATRDTCNCSSCMGQCHGQGMCSCKDAVLSS